MTRTATVSPASLAFLMKASVAIEQANELMRQVTLNDTAQGDLFEPGADQACESFMEEREELQAQLTAFSNRALLAETVLTQELESQGVYTQSLRSEIERLSEELIDTSNALHRAREDNETAFATLTTVAQFCQLLKARLNAIGITWSQDPETGEPRVAVNLRELDEAVREMIDRS